MGYMGASNIYEQRGLNMTFQHRSGAGSLFKNKLKQEGENTPDYRGEININGGLYELAAWIK
jgi:hypothetical protein